MGFLQSYTTMTQEETGNADLLFWGALASGFI